MEKRQQHQIQRFARHNRDTRINRVAAEGDNKRGNGGDHTGFSADDQGKDNITGVKDPRKHPEYETDLIKTIAELEKVLNMLKNRECVLFGAQQAQMVLKQGKGMVGKPTGIKRLIVDYSKEMVI